MPASTVLLDRDSTMVWQGSGHKFGSLSPCLPVWSPSIYSACKSHQLPPHFYQVLRLPSKALSPRILESHPTSQGTPHQVTSRKIHHHNGKQARPLQPVEKDLRGTRLTDRPFKQWHSPPQQQLLRMNRTYYNMSSPVRHRLIVGIQHYGSVKTSILRSRSLLTYDLWEGLIRSQHLPQRERRKQKTGKPHLHNKTRNT